MKSAFTLILLLLLWLSPRAQQDTIVRYWAGNAETNVLSKAKTRAAYYWKDGLWLVESRYFPSGKLYMTGSYLEEEAKTKQGEFKWYHENGNLSNVITYDDNKEEGLRKSWHESGRIKDSFFYRNGNLVKKGRQWNDKGHITQDYDLDENGSGKVKLYRDKDSLLAEGEYQNGLRNGRWIYYSPEAYKEWEVDYSKDSVLVATCFDAAGIERKDCIWEREALPPGGVEGWKRYLSKVLNKANYPSRKLMKKEKNLDGTVWVRFLVEKDGSLGDIQIIRSLNAEADQIVEDAIRNSPRWSPGIQRNKVMRSYHTQPLTFQVSLGY